MSNKWLSILRLAVCLSVATAQLQLDNSVELDPEGTFRLDWSVIYDDVNNPLIIMETRVKTQGWVSLRWTQGLRADFFWGAFNPNNLIETFHRDMHCILTTDGDACVLQFGPLNDDVNNFVIEAQGYNERTNQTIHRFERRKDSGDADQDIVIPNGPMVLGWAWSDKIFENGPPAPITKRGLTNITLIP